MTGSWFLRHSAAESQRKRSRADDLELSSSLGQHQATKLARYIRECDVSETQSGDVQKEACIAAGLCWAYQQGRCHKGSRCIRRHEEFHHAGPLEVEWAEPTRPKGVCQRTRMSIPSAVQQLAHTTRSRSESAASAGCEARLMRRGTSSTRNTRGRRPTTSRAVAEMDGLSERCRARKRSPRITRAQQQSVETGPEVLRS